MEECMTVFPKEVQTVPQKMGELRPVNIPVQMMAVTDRDGKVTPLWFRFETEDHHIEKVAVERTISRDESVFVGVREKRFVCSVVIGEERHLIELRYHIENQKWRIFQFLS
ncbi:MAG: hypothetical protein IJX66_03355 [Lachnospiraceae bacterium]|nr:hypothetical protein [Lachnospiraceae bacterium]